MLVHLLRLLLRRTALHLQILLYLSALLSNPVPSTQNDATPTLFLVAAERRRMLRREPVQLRDIFEPAEDDDESLFVGKNKASPPSLSANHDESGEQRAGGLAGPENYHDERARETSGASRKTSATVVNRIEPDHHVDRDTRTAPFAVTSDAEYYNPSAALAVGEKKETVATSTREQVEEQESLQRTKRIRIKETRRDDEKQQGEDGENKEKATPSTGKTTSATFELVKESSPFEMSKADGSVVPYVLRAELYENTKTGEGSRYPCVLTDSFRLIGYKIDAEQCKNAKMQTRFQEGRFASDYYKACYIAVPEWNTFAIDEDEMVRVKLAEPQVFEAAAGAIVKIEPEEVSDLPESDSMIPEPSTGLALVIFLLFVCCWCGMIVCSMMMLKCVLEMFGVNTSVVWKVLGQLKAAALSLKDTLTAMFRGKNKPGPAEDGREVEEGDIGAEDGDKPSEDGEAEKNSDDEGQDGADAGALKEDHADEAGAAGEAPVQPGGPAIIKGGKKGLAPGQQKSPPQLGAMHKGEKTSGKTVQKGVVAGAAGGLKESGKVVKGAKDAKSTTKPDGTQPLQQPAAHPGAPPGKQMKIPAGAGKDGDHPGKMKGASSSGQLHKEAGGKPALQQPAGSKPAGVLAGKDQQQPSLPKGPKGTGITQSPAGKSPSGGQSPAAGRSTSSKSPPGGGGGGGPPAGSDHKGGKKSPESANIKGTSKSPPQMMKSGVGPTKQPEALLAANKGTTAGPGKDALVGSSGLAPKGKNSAKSPPQNTAQPPSSSPPGRPGSLVGSKQDGSKKGMNSNSNNKGAPAGPGVGIVVPSQEQPPSERQSATSAPRGPQAGSPSLPTRGSSAGEMKGKQQQITPSSSKPGSKSAAGAGSPPGGAQQPKGSSTTKMTSDKDKNMMMNKGGDKMKGVKTGNIQPDLAPPQEESEVVVRTKRASHDRVDMNQKGVGLLNKGKGFPPPPEPESEVVVVTRRASHGHSGEGGPMNHPLPTPGNLGKGMKKK
ncbi:unnamed protein product [Amoebophrya sp. A120]|nr:unnamed protein product [Amoebophrya sp. A120]|eukprot:GSA120T00004613001.1